LRREQSVELPPRAVGRYTPVKAEQAVVTAPLQWQGSDKPQHATTATGVAGFDGLAQ